MNARYVPPKEITKVIEIEDWEGKPLLALVTVRVYDDDSYSAAVIKTVRNDDVRALWEDL